MPIPITGTISGSRAATVLGLNKYQTPFEVWQKIMEEREEGFNEKHGYDMPPPPDNAAIRWGSAFENAHIAVRPERIIKREKIYRKSLDCGAVLSCHIDGMIDHQTLFEGKTTTSRAFNALWTDDKVPQNYMIQIQHNMYLADVDNALVSVLVFPDTPDYYEAQGWEPQGNYLVRRHTDFIGGARVHSEERVHMNKWARTLQQMGAVHSFYVDRDDELIEMMLAKYTQFWEKYVLTKTPPKPMDVDDIKRMYPEPKGTVLIDDKNVLDTFAKYRQAKERSAALNKEIATLKKDVLRFANEYGGDDKEKCSDKTVFRDSEGSKLGSWGKEKRGWVLR